MKKIMRIAFVAAFATVAGYGVYTNQRTETMSDLMLANVEALASGEASVKDVFLLIQTVFCCIQLILQKMKRSRKLNGPK